MSYRVKYTPGQARDDRGRFGSGHGGGGARPLENLEREASDSKGMHFIERGDDVHDKDTRSIAKDAGVQAVTERIMADPAKVKAVIGGDPSPRARTEVYNEVNSLTGLWAQTSGDDHPAAIAFQRATAREFGFKDAEKHLERNTHEDTWKDSERHLATREGAYRTIARAHYEHTQEQLKAARIESVVLHRGMNLGEEDENGNVSGLPPWINHGKVENPNMHPLSSFSTDYHTAKTFAVDNPFTDSMEGSRVLSARVPASAVFSTARTGMGCLTEYEYILLPTKGVFNNTVPSVKSSHGEAPRKKTLEGYMQHGALERKVLEAANDSIIDDLEAQFIVDLLTAFDVLAENAAALLPGTFAVLGAGALSTLGATALSQSTHHFQVAFTSAQTEASRQAMTIVQAASGAKPSDLTKPMVQAQVEYDHRTRLQALLPELGRQTTDAIAAAVKKSIESGWGPYEAKKEVRRLVAGANMYPGVAEEKDDEAAARYRSTVIARTEVAWARNTATTRYFDAAPDVAGLYVVDGPECGWAHHDDEQKANGIHVTFEMARNYPIAHPNCRRSFGPVFAEGKWLQYFLELKYNPNQARGADGRWSGGFHHGPTRADLIQGPLQSELAPAPKPKKPPKPQGAPNAGTGVGTHHPDRHNTTPQGSGPKGETKPAGGNVDQKAEQYVTKGHEYWLDGKIDPEMEHVWTKMTHDTAEAVLGDPELKKRANAVGLKSRPQITMMAHNMSNQWVSSATDSEPKSIALHLAAHEEFGLDPEGHKEFLSRTDPKALAEAQKHYAANGEKERVLLRGMYNATQKDLAAQGITEVTLHRGLLAERKSNMKDGVQHVHHNALNSYTSSDWVADGYADGTLGTTYLTDAYASGKLQGKVISATIPASHIFSTGHTGFGSVADREYIVLGAKGGKVNVKAYGE